MREVVDIDAQNPQATIIADLGNAEGIRSDTFDCFIFTQTLQFIYEPRAALRHIHRILRPGGVLLATVPGLSRVERAYADSDYWRFTPAACQKLFAEVFGPAQLIVHSYGNILAAIGFLTGLAREELERAELEEQDVHFPVVVGIRAVKAK